MKQKRQGMTRGKKFDRTRKEPMKRKRKPKFNKRTSIYIKEREAKNEAIEKRRKELEERKAKQQAYYSDSSSEEEQEPLDNLLKTFSGSNNLKKRSVVSDSESEESDEVEEEEEEEEEEMAVGENFRVDEEVSEDDIDNEGEISDDVDDDDSDGIDDDVNENSDGTEDDVNENSDEADGDVNENSDESDGDVNENSDAEEEEIEIQPDENEEDEETAREDAGDSRDNYTKHLKNDLDTELYQAVTSVPVCLKTEKLKWPTVGNVICQIPHAKTKPQEPAAKKTKVSILEEKSYAEHGKVPQVIKKVDWDELYVKSLIQGNITKANYENIKDDLDENPSPLTPLQKELFSVINNYQDLLYADRTFDNESQIRFIYCLHVVNHILKSRTKVLHHNAKFHKAKLTDMSDIPDEYRDQGLVRPKVLILVPFRHSCLEIVKTLISIFIGEDKGGSVINKKRFMEDFSGNEIKMSKMNPKPEDYQATFKGNTDDNFKIGLSITKKALKLYSDFYSSDIIISSVLGLRTIIGAEGEEERDYDFLASIELLVMDQTELFFMQNWDHLLHIFEHMHLQPKDSHGTDFGRVRSWCVNGWSKYYRQTLIFSSIHLPEINGIFNKNCCNYAGKVKVMNPISVGTVAQVTVQAPQYFDRFNVSDYSKSMDTRFEFFISKILPLYRDSIMNHTLIFVPSYFDYVKLRNYFRKEELNFVQICEYSKPNKVARARDMFFHSDAHCVLYTERYHFYHRKTIKGIRHIIFYAPPVYPHFYSEMCNLMQEGYQNPNSGSASHMSIRTIYCKYDSLPISAIVGSERASKMISSDKTDYMIMTDR